MRVLFFGLFCIWKFFVSLAVKIKKWDCLENLQNQKKNN